VIAQAIIDALLDRQGFDEWWHEIDPDIKQDILDEINSIFLLRIKHSG
jgi:hypothetical protein